MRKRLRSEDSTLTQPRLTITLKDKQSGKLIHIKTNRFLFSIDDDNKNCLEIISVRLIGNPAYSQNLRKARG